MGNDDEEADYVSEVGAQLIITTNALARTGELAKEGDANSLYDSAWRTQMLRQVDTLREAYALALVQEPPARFVEFHGQWLLALEILDEGASLIATGIEQRDVALIGSGGEKFSEASIALDIASSMWDDLLGGD